MRNKLKLLLRVTCINLLCIGLSLVSGADPIGKCPDTDNEISVILLDDSNATIYYVCVWGTPVMQACPAGLFFNPVTEQCDYPENVDTSHVTKGGGSDPSGGGSGGGNTPNGRKCTKAVCVITIGLPPYQTEYHGHYRHCGIGEANDYCKESKCYIDCDAYKW